MSLKNQALSGEEEPICMACVGSILRENNYVGEKYIRIILEIGENTHKKAIHQVLVENILDCTLDA